MIIALMLLLAILAIIITWVSIKVRKSSLKNSFLSIHQNWQRLSDLARQIIEYAQKIQVKEDSISENTMQIAGVLEKNEQEIVISNKMKNEITQLIECIENQQKDPANYDFNRLQRCWYDTRFQLESGCDEYVQSVIEYNQKLHSFPGNLLAGMFQLETIEDCGVCTEADAGLRTVKFH